MASVCPTSDHGGGLDRVFGWRKPSPTALGLRHCGGLLKLEPAEVPRGWHGRNPVRVIEPGAVASEFGASISRPADWGPHALLPAGYAARTQSAFAHAQAAQNAGVAQAATSPSYRCRWQTSDQARVLPGSRC